MFTVGIKKLPKGFKYVKGFVVCVPNDQGDLNYFAFDHIKKKAYAIADEYREKYGWRTVVVRVDKDERPLRRWTPKETKDEVKEE